MPRGGKRSGAGRPKVRTTTRSVTLYLSVEGEQKLNAIAQSQKVPKGQVVENLLSTMKLYYFPSLAIRLQSIPLYTAEQVAEMNEAEKQVIQEVDEAAIAHFREAKINFYFAQKIGSLEACKKLEAQMKNST